MKRAILLFALISAPAGAQTWSDNGLETANYKYVAVTVEDFTADAGEIGLARDRIQARVELRLRSVGLTPGKDSTKNGTYLYVNVHVADNVFNILVKYNRLVGFITGNRRYRQLATTWESGTTGTHGRNTAFIMVALDRHLDRFLNEYLKVNQK